MRLVDLAGGALVFAHTTKYDVAYMEFLADRGLRQRLRTAPSPGEVERLRDFIQRKYGVRFMPKKFVPQYLAAWPLLKPHIDEVASESLLSCNLNSALVNGSIESAYRILIGPRVWGGDTVASKVLHLLNPSLCVMWDDKIKNGKSGPAGYLAFLESMQHAAAEARSDFAKVAAPGSLEDHLSRQIGYRATKPLTKLLDDYNWIVAAKEWPDRMPRWLLDLAERSDAPLDIAHLDSDTHKR